MAKVLSSISGNLISAASAGYAPTNSADVSAIASAYQVVSATGTQLYAGTAHVTSINSAPISASRAGNAANASMATSAYYDGTGRLISALPDAAEVSAIASAYADDKLDKTAEVVTATAGDGTYVTSINGMEISGQGGGGAQVVTATGSASATAFTGGFPGIGTSYLISSINGSALLPYGYSVLSGNSAGWTSTNSAVSANSAKWTSTNSAVSANSAKWTSTNSAVSANSAKWTSTNSAVSANSAKWNSVYNTVSSNSASWSGSTAGSVTSPSGTIVVMNDNEIEGTNSAVLTASAGDGFSSELTPVRNYIDSNWYRLYDGILPASGATLTLHTDPIWGSNVYFSGKKLDGTISLFDVSVSGGNGATSLTVDLGEIAREISAYATTYVVINGKMTAEKVGGIQVTGVGELAWKSAVDNVTNTVSSNSASWGQGGVDSATVSSIASSYAQSAVSSKADSSALSSYALSADVSSTVDLVSTQSANWGGSALALSAGPGVKLEKVGDTLVAGLDETVLWSGTYQNTATGSIVLNESWKNFQKIEVYGFNIEGKVPLAGIYYTSPFSGESLMEVVVGTQGFATWGNPATFNVSVSIPCRFTSETAVDIGSAKYIGNWNSNWQASNNINGRTYISKVVGVNRTAGF